MVGGHHSKPTLQLATQDGGTKTVRLGHHDVDAKPRTVSAPAGQGILHATGTPSAPATTDSEDSDYLDEEFETFDDHDAPPSPAKSVVSVDTESPPPAPPSVSASSSGLVRQLQLSAQDRWALFAWFAVCHLPGSPIAMAMRAVISGRCGKAWKLPPGPARKRCLVLVLCTTYLPNHGLPVAAFAL